jgi:hypothetical protein
MPGVVSNRTESSAMACRVLDLGEMKLVEIEEEAGRRSVYGDISDTSWEGGEPSFTAPVRA